MQAEDFLNDDFLKQFKDETPKVDPEASDAGSHT